MNKEQFLQLINEIKVQIQDITIRREYLENKFIQYGYSIESGYKVVSHYYQELKKARDRNPSIFTGTIIHNEKNETFALVSNHVCIFKMTYIDFEGLKILFENNQLTGFTCNLHPDTVKEIYIFMAGENYLSGKLDDFQAIFSKVSIPVENPVEWLVKNERGTNPDRGNQTALFVFLELILKKVSNQDLIKSKDLFIDEKGKFIKNKLLRPDKDKLKKYGFETQLKDILKKADQPKNQ